VLARLRAQQGLSQEAVAAKAGLTVGTYARIERQKAEPTWVTVRQLAPAFGVTLVQLAKLVEAEP
jgi:transcriptional regulator with XRE-family HTH domain